MMPTHEPAPARDDFHSIFRLSLDPMVVTDDAGTFLEVNVAAEALFGAGAKLLRGQSLANFVLEPSAKTLRWAELLESGTQRGELELRRADGLVRAVEFSATAQFSPHRHLVMLRDVTDRRAAERRKDEFLAALGHELRSPLAPLFTALEVMRPRCAEDATLSRARDAVERQARNLARLVDDLLDVSRLAQGHMELRLEPVSLRTAVEHAVAVARPLISSREHELDLELGVEPLLVEADPARLEQIAANLLANAAKFTPPGGRISVATAREGSQAILRVTDSGVGMARELLPRVFDSFVQADESLDRPQGGLGLGLTLVQQLVHLHGGTVDAHSDGPGWGAEFVVRLPLAKASHALPPEPQPPATAIQPRLTVLVAEDHPDARELLCELLELWGQRVETAADGRTAVDAALGQQCELALVDIGLPELDGYEVAKQVRAAEEAKGAPRCYLVALTGYGQAQAHARALAAGFDEHRTKPVTARTLRELIAAAAARAKKSS